jgi:phosphomannomutase
MKFIFDVDGTLTPSRKEMNQEFFAWFDDFCSDNEVYLVTGSDYPKTVEQLGDYLCEKVKTVYNCSGNDVWQKGKRIRSRSFTAPKELYTLMDGWLQSSLFPARTGNHIEERPGTINFSVVGRNATPIERAEYVIYDKKNRERETIAHIINSEFDNITATVGGETGIDIYNTGCDKSQIMKDFWVDDKIIFFGDRMDEKGNDYPLAQVNTRGKNYHVYDWRHTWELLKGMT